MQIFHDFSEICEMHGGSPVRTGNGWTLPDGSVVVAHVVQVTSYETEGPPADALQNLRARQRYNSVRLDEVTHDFERLKLAVSGFVSPDGVAAKWTWPSARYGAMPTETDVYGAPCGKTALARLKAIADDRRLAVEKMDAEIEALPEMQHKRELAQLRQQESARQRQQDDRHRAEIASIQLAP